MRRLERYYLLGATDEPHEPVDTNKAHLTIVFITPFLTVMQSAAEAARRPAARNLTVRSGSGWTSLKAADSAADTR